MTGKSIVDWLSRQRARCENFIWPHAAQTDREFKALIEELRCPQKRTPIDIAVEDIGGRRPHHRDT